MQPRGSSSRTRTGPAHASRRAQPRPCSSLIASVRPRSLPGAELRICSRSRSARSRREDPHQSTERPSLAGSCRRSPRARLEALPRGRPRVNGTSQNRKTTLRCARSGAGSKFGVSMVAALAAAAVLALGIAAPAGGRGEAQARAVVAAACDREALGASSCSLAASPRRPRTARRSGSVFYSPTDWLRLATKLAANEAQCAEYYVSVPPLAADKTNFRPDQPWRIRALGPELPCDLRDQLQRLELVGRRRPARAGTPRASRRAGGWLPQGFDVTAGDIWAVNESSSAVRQGTGNARKNLRDLVRGLYDGGGERAGRQGRRLRRSAPRARRNTSLSFTRGTLQSCGLPTPRSGTT